MNLKNSASDMQKWQNNATSHVASVGSNSEGEYFFQGPYVRQPRLPLERVALYAPDFFLSDQNPWWVFEKVTKSTFKPGTENVRPIELNLNAPALAEFSYDFEKIQTAIAAGEIKKAVPVVLAKSERPDSFMNQDGLSKIYYNLKLNCSDARTLCFLGGETEGLAGLTPELLFSWDINEHRVTTMALAGTAADGDPEGLLKNKKELHEHNLVIESIFQGLAKMGTVEVGETKVAKAGSLFHLRTEIHCRLHDRSVSEQKFNELIKALHPTPALGLSSSTHDFHWLKTLANSNVRQRFGAPFGYWDPAVGARIFVAIRNIQWNEKGVYLFTGCGVVEGSDLHAEWKELERKRNSVLRDLGVLL